MDPTPLLRVLSFERVDMNDLQYFTVDINPFKTQVITFILTNFNLQNTTILTELVAFISLSVFSFVFAVFIFQI